MAKVKFEDATNKLAVYYWRYWMTENCTNGHERTVENTYTNVRGRPACLLCQRQANANWRAKNREYLRQKGLAHYYQKKAARAEVPGA